MSITVTTLGPTLESKHKKNRKINTQHPNIKGIL